MVSISFNKALLLLEIIGLVNFPKQAALCLLGKLVILFCMFLIFILQVYGYIADGPLKGVPIAGCLGDQQAALVGQMCLQKGQAKATYGTGCFVLYNTGDIRVNSTRGLLTTVAYQLGSNNPPSYALEGSVSGETFIF